MMEGKNKVISVMKTKLVLIHFTFRLVQYCSAGNYLNRWKLQYRILIVDVINIFWQVVLFTVAMPTDICQSSIRYRISWHILSGMSQLPAQFSVFSLPYNFYPPPSSFPFYLSWYSCTCWLIYTYSYSFKQILRALCLCNNLSFYQTQ